MRKTTGLLLFTLTMIACSSKPNVSPGTNAACDGIQIDRFKELIIVEETIVSDARARNDKDGPWSFRKRMEELTPPGQDPALTAVNWLNTFKSVQRVNLFEVPVRRLVEQQALCNWRRALPSNQCDVSCSACVANTYDLSVAPFRLMSIANRGDLRSISPDPETAGEVRFTYALTQGAGDDPASKPLFMSVNFEYRQPLRGRTEKAVDQAWHALGTHADFDEAYKQDLEALLKTFTEQGAEPSRPVGSALAQLRVNEKEFEWDWSMREYLLTPSGLAITYTENTPDLSVNGSSQLAEFLNANRDDILAGKHVLPSRLEGGKAGILNSWTATGVETNVTDAFSRETCNGCHQNNNIDINFHVSSHKTGRDKLSKFVNNPADPAHDDTGRRETFLRSKLCE